MEDRSLALGHDELLALSKVRGRIHQRANDFFVCEQKRWDASNWRLFFGATDALLDTEYALSNMPNGIPTDRQNATLACYGFLQALYIQQDATAIIWRALGISGSALSDIRVQRVRELRNRIAGHPARADKMRGKRPSSAIINLHDINPSSGFKAVIYYDDETDVVDVSFTEILADNCSGLTEALLQAEIVMVEKEKDFRSDQKANPLAVQFENGLTYTLEKLRCDPNDGRREMAIRLLSKSLDELESLLKDRGFFYEASDYPISSIRAGLDLGRRLHDIATPDRIQQSWWVISEGIDSHVKNLLRHLHALDEKLATDPD